MTHQDYQLYIHYYLEIQFEDFYRKERKKERHIQGHLLPLDH